MIVVVTITLAGVAQNVADTPFIPAPAATAQTVTGRALIDAACRTISLQADAANSHIVAVGADSTVTTSAFGLGIPIPTGAALGAPVILGAYDQGGIRLSDLWIIGTAGEKLHVLAVVI
jgi:hypothetical protein